MTIPPALKRRDAVLNQHLEFAWKQAGRERLDQHNAVHRETRIFDLVLGCDPTREGKYSGWLSLWRRRQWSTCGLRYVFSMEDLEDLANGLRHFHDLGPHLTGERRDVGKYETAADLWAASDYLSDNSRKRLQKERKRQALQGTDILFDSREWKLVRLRDQAAATWWGMGTRWCTAARNGNRFETYALTGQLLVVIAPSGRYQLHTGTHEFRDAADAAANLRSVTSAAPPGLLDALNGRLATPPISRVGR